MAAQKNSNKQRKSLVSTLFWRQIFDWRNTADFFQLCELIRELRSWGSKSLQGNGIRGDSGDADFKPLGALRRKKK